MAKDTYNNFYLPYDGESGAITTIASALQYLSRLASWEKTFLTGLQLEWLSATGVRIKPGAAYVQSVSTNANNLVKVSANIDKTGLSLSASTWYHLYLYDVSGVATVEVVTTAPTNYFGTAYQKTADATRRYLGSVRTDASGNIYRFIHFEGRIRYLVPTNASPFRALSAGGATSRTSVSLSSTLPVTARLAIVRLLELGGQIASIGSPDDSGTYIFQVVGNGSIAAEVPADSSQGVTYSVVAGGSLYIDVLGYVFQR